MSKSVPDYAGALSLAVGTIAATTIGWLAMGPKAAICCFWAFLGGAAAMILFEDFMAWWYRSRQGP